MFVFDIFDEFFSNLILSQVFNVYDLLYVYGMINRVLKIHTKIILSRIQKLQ